MWKLSFFQTSKKDWNFIFPVSSIFVIASLITAYDYVQIQGMVHGFNIVNIVGLSLFLIGVSIRVVARKTLGRYFSSGLKIVEEHRLIKHGIYKHIRHPAYLGSNILSIGIPLFFTSLYGALIMLGLVPLFLYRIKIEENMLIEKFGEEYREYMKNTNKLIPFIY